MDEEEERFAGETREMPMMTRDAPVKSVDEAARTVDVTWTTGAQVRRYDYYNDRAYLEELSLDPAHVRMGRLTSGRAPVLDTHSRWGLGSVLGVVQRADIGGATLKMSKRADVAPILEDVRDGIIGNVSVGYTVHKIQRIAPAKDGDTWIYRAIDWEPSEISFVPIGADAGAGTRSDDPRQAAQPGERALRTYPCEFVGSVSTETRNHPPAAAGNHREASDMTEEEKKAAEAAEQKRAKEAAAEAERKRIAEEARKQEAERQNEIRSLCATGRMDAAFTQRLLDDGNVTAEQAGLAILREQARLAAANPTRVPANVQMGRDEVDQRRECMGNAIILRANPGARLVLGDDAANRRALESAREYRGMTLVDMARDCIERAGGSTRGMSRREVAVAALNMDQSLGIRSGQLSTSDFPNVLASTVNRTLRQAYQLAPRTFTGWARQATAPDFRQVARTQLSDLGRFQPVNEGGEYKFLSFGDSAEKYSLGKYGGIVALTWESIVNDDLSAFDRVPAMIAAEAAATEADIVYGILLNNANMADGTALFAAGHGNLPSAAAITDLTLGSGRQLMYVQTGPNGRVLNLRPVFLVVGPAKEMEANKYTSASFVATKGADIAPNFNTSLQVIVDARITGNKWFLIASPSQIDTVEYAYLEGEEGLFTETQVGFEVDGVKIKARHVFAAKAIDWRGMVYNSGL